MSELTVSTTQSTRAPAALDSAVGTSPDQKDVASATSGTRRKIIKTGDRYEPGWIEAERKNLQAYEYLCRIGEAKDWIESISKQQLPPIETLDEELRNGIYLAYLAKAIKPECVGRIFEDRTKLQFRHSDNINFLFKTMRKVGLPELFIFELTDLYDKKNFPKVVYCIHAFSHLLFKKGMAPSIGNLVGQLSFTDETLEQTQQGLEDAGVNLPAFNSVSAVLEKELEKEPEPTEEEKRQKFFMDNLALIIKAQSILKGRLQRRRYLNRLQEFKDNEDKVVKMQAARKAKKVRKAFVERKQFFKAHEDKIVKIQATWKGKKIEKAYKDLSTLNNPPVKSLREFLFLLDENDFDYKEEIDLERLRQKVVKLIRENIQVEANLGDLDVKISLLVKNRISLEEVAQMTSKKMKQKLNVQGVEDSSVINLKGTDKESRQKVENYQYLFYLLQTQPEYLSKMMFLMNNKSGGNVTKVLEGYVMALYGYAQNSREEYLLLQLITAAAKIEVDAIQELSEFWRSNPLFIKLVLHYTRGARERVYIRDLLVPLIKTVIADGSADLDTDPATIYKTLIRAEESSTGEKSKRDYEATVEQMAQDPEVQQIQQRNAENLIQVADKFLNAIIGSLTKMPYGIRYIAQKIQQKLSTKFKGQDEEVTKIIGNLIYYRYINPAIVAPEGFDVLDTAITPNQRKSLAEVAKVLHLISVKKEFAAEDFRPAKLSDFILQKSRQFSQFFKDCTLVPSAEDHFEMNEYVDLGRNRKPTIYISANEIFEIHRNLIEYADDICSGPQDPLKIILNDLGQAPAASEKEHSNAGNEITLVLSNKFAKLEDADAVSKTLLYNETKALIFNVIRIQNGTNLVEILQSATTAAEEEAYESFIKREQQKRKDAIGSSTSLAKGVSDPSKPYQSVTSLLSSTELLSEGYAGIKKKASKNLEKLEEFGLVHKQQKYQEILNDLAKDMLNKHRRRRQRAKELESLRKTLETLNEKSRYLEDQRKSYHDYVQSCMSQFSSKKSKQKKPLPFTRQYFHLKSLQKTGNMPQFGSFKYSAEQLYKKGVLVSVTDFSPKQYDKITITFSSNEAGLFNVEASFAGVKVETTELRLEDLLQYQYDNVSVISLFDDAAKVNVNLLVYLVNKKFYA